MSNLTTILFAAAALYVLASAFTAFPAGNDKRNER